MFGATLLSIIGSLFSGIGGLSGISGFFGSLFGQGKQYKYQQRLQDDAQLFTAQQSELARLFNANESQLNRDFNARQAEIARQWQEDFYNNYQSPSAMMSQYKDAGINPVLALGHPTSSPPSVSSASGSPASSPAGSSGIGSAQGSSLIRDIVSLVALKSQIQSMDADTQLKRAEARGVDSQISLNNSVMAVNSSVSRLNEKQISAISQHMELEKEQAKTEQSKREIMVAQRALYASEKEKIEFGNALSREFKKEFGYDAPIETINMLIGQVGQLINGLSNSVISNLNPLKLIKEFKGKRN